MYRRDMVACGRHAERIQMICELMDFDEGIKAKILAEVDAIIGLLEESTDAERRRDRDRKTQRDSQGNSGIPEPTVVVVEEVVVEEVLKGVQGEMEPPAFIKPNVAQFVDEVIGHFNRITGSRYSTGPKRNKAHSRLIGARLKQEADLAAGDFAKAVKRTEMLIRLYHQKWANDAKQAQYLRPATLFTEDKWADRMEETRQWTQSQNGGMR